MPILIVIGITGLLFGAAVLVSPDTVKKWSRRLDRLVATIDGNIVKYRFSIGIVSLAVGVVALYVSYYINMSHIT